MEIVLSNANQQPIYEQIYTQIKNQIISGHLQPGQMLPSIRNLAKDLRISVITTKRAYEELERSGYLTTVAGKGSFVAQPDTRRIQEEYLLQIEACLQKAADLAPACDLTADDLVQMLRLCIQED